MRALVAVCLLFALGLVMVPTVARATTYTSRLAPDHSLQNEIDVALEVVATSETASAISQVIEAETSFGFEFDDSSNELTVTDFVIRSEDVRFEFAPLFQPKAAKLQLTIDESSSLYPPTATVNGTTGAVTIEVPYVFEGEFMTLPASRRGEMELTGTFSHDAPGRFELTGVNGSLLVEVAFFGYVIEVDAEVDLNLAKWRNAADLNGDGVSDPTVRLASSNEWLATFDGTATDVDVTHGVSSDLPLIGDFNGDGIGDLVAFRDGTTPSWLVTYSPDFSGTDLSVNFGTEGDTPFVCDFDGDGYSDIGVTRASQFGFGDFEVRFGPSYSSGTDIDVTWRLDDEARFFGDHNGDGQCDLIMVRDGYKYYVSLSPNWNGTDVTKWYGASGDTPVPADYDGDGKIDLAYVRESSGELLWRATFSSSSWTGTQLDVTFGQAGDVPVVDDYNGDGRADLAVFRDGTWEISLAPDFDGVDRVITLGASGSTPLHRPDADNGVVGAPVR